jgi:hypothetical protein
MKSRLALATAFLVAATVAGLAARGYVKRGNEATDLRRELVTAQQQFASLQTLAASQRRALQQARAPVARLREQIVSLEDPKLEPIQYQILSDGPSQVNASQFAPTDASIIDFLGLPGRGDIPPQVIISWRRAGVDVYPPRDGGVFVWQARPNPHRHYWADPRFIWRVVYEDYLRGSSVSRIGRPGELQEGTSGNELVTFTSDDVTGDRYPDFLTFDATDGSGGCGAWRVLTNDGARIVSIFRRYTCDTGMRVSGGELRIAASVYKSSDSHCCPSFTRFTNLRWTGRGWVVVQRKLVRNRL